MSQRNTVLKCSKRDLCIYVIGVDFTCKLKMQIEEQTHLRMTVVTAFMQNLNEIGISA